MVPIYYTVTSSSTCSTGYTLTWTDWTCTATTWIDPWAPQVRAAYEVIGAAGYVAPMGVRQMPSLLRHQSNIVRAHTLSAQTRARDLLLSHMSEEQRRQFETENVFIVIGGKSGKRYRIAGEDHLAANIEVLRAENDNAEIRLCAHPALSAVPLSDHLLSQKLMLEFDEERFLRLANRHAA